MTTSAPATRRALTEGQRSERRLGLWLCAPAALIMVLVTGWPIVYSVLLSLQRYDLRFPDDRAWVGLSNYAVVLTNEFWWSAFWVTLVITVISVSIELVLGMLLALAMYRAIVGRGLVRTVVLIPYGIVTVAAAYGWKYAWTPGTGWLAAVLPEGTAPLTDRLSAIAIIILAEVWKTTPFMALLLMAGMAVVPEELL
ncbi:carbohydrate ABC transporter permease, partial [Nocardia aurea]|uniref:carbohydrate ABC transporter permease n=1 Tax=Nocardia aurea TaxID=2144174 RepID=UPI001E447D4D